MSGASWTGEPLSTTDLPSAARIADSWMDAVLGTGHVAVHRVHLRGVLGELAERLRTAAASPRFDRTVARGIGVDLVTAHLTDPASLEASLLTLGRELGSAAGTPGRTARVTAVQAALGAGFAAELTTVTRVEQAFGARAAAEHARWTSEARFHAVFDDAPIGIAAIDTDGRITEVNKSLCELLGFRSDELTTRTVFDFEHPKDAPEIWGQVKELFAGSLDVVRLVKCLPRKDGRGVWTDVVVSLVRGADGDPRFAIGMVEDITERRRLEHRLLHQAHHDPLTGLPNRTLFFERLDAALADPDRQLGLCYLDLDGFKGVNDTLGHDVGDRLLQIVAERLDVEIAEHLVARTGGDEFVVLVEHRGGEETVVGELGRCAHAALAAVQRPTLLGSHHIVVSASVGVVTRCDVPTGAAELMKAADTTLYWAKKDGRNRIALFDAERHHRDVDRFELSARMPEALERDEFAVVYQPLIRLSDSRVVGVEALVRWDLPSGERLSPDRFIPMAEETGLIVPLGRWVLAEACRQAAEWQRAVPDVALFVSVNLAARQVREPGMVSDVAAILAETGWPAYALQMELTESDLMGTTGESLAALHELAALGVQIAIDDFGTGYSNLAYLRQLPVHTLKLAGRFVTGHGEVGTDEVDVEVTKLLIRLAHVLSLSVTAESVETAAQLQQLRELGCDFGQGWYFSPAVDAATITDLLHRLPPARHAARSAARSPQRGARISG
jgi:diguanylate cyclase (GGDEF)-like protein/PAS domain S-box-containing protein